jgi:hypothetical protein
MCLSVRIKKKVELWLSSVVTQKKCVFCCNTKIITKLVLIMGLLKESLCFCVFLILLPIYNNTMSILCCVCVLGNYVSEIQTENSRNFMEQERQ